MSLLEQLGMPQEPKEPIERRRLYVAARFARVDRRVIDALDQQPYSDPSLDWEGVAFETAFCNTLNGCLASWLGFLDPVASEAVRLRCIVYGKASEEDFSFLPEDDYARFITKEGWEISVVDGGER